MKTKITPFIEATDYEYMDNFSKGYHLHQPLLNIQRIEIGYPLVQDLNTTRKYNVDMQDATIGRLMHAISAILINEDCAGNNYGPHRVEDYCIEIINIDNGIATISIGS